MPNHDRILSFDKFDAGGNPTLIIDNRDRRIPTSAYGALAKQLMAEPYVGGEQVGYAERPRDRRAIGRLNMMGGELCINALRCFALLASNGNPGRYFIESSGLANQVEVTVERVGAGHRSAVLLEAEAEIHSLNDGVLAVTLPGITHFVERLGSEPTKVEMVERLAMLVESGRACGIPTEAAGYMGVVHDSGTWRLFPTVSVMASGSVVHETSCGSGSLACFLVMERETSEGALILHQPSDEFLEVRRLGAKIMVKGAAKHVASGTAFA